MAKEDKHGNDPSLISQGELSVLLKALVHPLRVELLQALAVEVGSPKELYNRLGHRLSSISYHVRVLASYEAVNLVKTVPRRGSVEHFYRATRLGIHLLELMGALPDDADPNPPGALAPRDSR